MSVHTTPNETNYLWKWTRVRLKLAVFKLTGLSISVQHHPDSDLQAIEEDKSNAWLLKIDALPQSLIKLMAPSLVFLALLSF